MPVDAKHLARIVDALESVVGEEGGTARGARVPGIRVAGKTGTAQVVRLKHVEGLEDGEIPIRFRDHAWFAGFAPVEAPEIVVVALVEHGGGGARVAAPVTQKVLAAYFADRLEAPPAVDAIESEAENGSGAADEEAAPEVVGAASGDGRARN